MNKVTPICQKALESCQNIAKGMDWTPIQWPRFTSNRMLSARLGKEQRRTIRATISLITIVVVFLVCHSLKVAVSAFQVVQVSLISVISDIFPSFVSHNCGKTSSWAWVVSEEGTNLIVQHYLKSLIRTGLTWFRGFKRTSTGRAFSKFPVSWMVLNY